MKKLDVSELVKSKLSREEAKKISGGCAGRFCNGVCIPYPDWIWHC